MATTSQIYTKPRRAGFTLIELLAVMLLILTVLGMGVPAMFAAERKSYVNQAMNELIRIHRICSGTQREIYTRGLPGAITLTINQSASNSPTVSIDGGNSVNNDLLKARLGCTPANLLTSMSINSDEFISSINATISPASYPTISWSYEPISGFIADNLVKTLKFQALKSGNTYKVERTVTIYPFGSTELP